MRSTSEGSQTLQNNRKSTKSWPNNGSQTGRTTTTRFFPSQTRLGGHFGRLGALLDIPGHPFWRPGLPLVTPPDAPGARRGRPKTLMRRSRDASGPLLGAAGCPERVPGPILVQFWVPRTSAGTDFGSIPASIFSLILQASWPANVITLLS